MTAPSESGRRARSILNSAVNPAEVASADSGFRLVTFALRPAAGGHPVRGNSRCPLASLLFGIFLHRNGCTFFLSVLAGSGLCLQSSLKVVIELGRGE